VILVALDEHLECEVWNEDEKLWVSADVSGMPTACRLETGVGGM
jgi:hypothetical protein